MKALSSSKLAIIGCGNLGGALVRGLVKSRSGFNKQITACDSREEVLEKLASDCQVNTSPDVGIAVRDADYVVLAVKPGGIAEVAKEVAAANSEIFAVLSVAAGVTVSKIREAIGDGPEIVRLMPNVACQVSHGMTGVFGDNDEAVSVAQGIFSSLGYVQRVNTEEELHGLTAVSGSGPAFVFSFIKALADGGVGEGLEPEVATRLAIKTLIGGATMLEHSGKTAEELIDMVASPNGTTVAGLGVLDEYKFQEIVGECVAAAARRSREISEE